MKRFLAIVALLLIGTVGATAQLRPLHESARIAPAAPHPGAELVRVGVLPTVVDDLNIATSTYDMTSYVWMRWNGTGDPTTTLEFANATERQNLVISRLFDAPKRLADGSRYQLMQVHGRFFQPFNLANFPFDHQSLALVLEDEVAAHDRFAYVPDTAESGFSARLQIPGWEIKGWQSQAITEDFATGFGAGGQVARHHAGLKFELVIARRLNFFVWKLLLPLIIVMCANWLALVIRPDLMDVRVALTATSLLTLIFLQKTYSDELPEIGTLVLMDQIYAVAFLSVLATLAHVVAVGWWQRHEAVAEKRIVRLDAISLGIHVLCFAVVVSVLVGYALSRY